LIQTHVSKFFQANRQFFQAAKAFSENPTVIKSENFFKTFADFISDFRSTLSDANGHDL
jgi:hypothetical protein